jgi:hypothetical protein
MDRSKPLSLPVVFFQAERSPRRQVHPERHTDLKPGVVKYPKDLSPSLEVNTAYQYCFIYRSIP